MTSQDKVTKNLIENKLDEALKELLNEIELIEEQTISKYVKVLEKDPIRGIDHLTSRFNDLTEYRKYIITLRSYILLTHAAIEDYIESIAKLLLLESIQNYRDNNKMNKVMMSGIISYSSSISKSKKYSLDNLFDRITEHLSKIVNDNNGIKITNMQKIYQQITNVDLYYASFDTLGSLRGTFAHHNIKNSQMNAKVFNKHSPQFYVENVIAVLNDIQYNLHQELVKEFNSIPN